MSFNQLGNLKDITLTTQSYNNILCSHKVMTWKFGCKSRKKCPRLHILFNYSILKPHISSYLASCTPLLCSFGIMGALCQLGVDYSGVGFRGQVPYKVVTNPKSRRCNQAQKKDMCMGLIIWTLGYVTLHENDVVALLRGYVSSFKRALNLILWNKGGERKQTAYLHLSIYIFLIKEYRRVFAMYEPFSQVIYTRKASVFFLF